jgi:hypothetical protein
MPPAGNRNGLCGRRSRPPVTEPVRAAGPRGVTAGPVCRLPDWGYSPSSAVTLPNRTRARKIGVTEMFTPPISLAHQETKFGIPYAISSITRIPI